MRSHPFPFRTRKLSSFTLMILGWRRPGKVNKCRYLLNGNCSQFPFFIKSLFRTISSVGQSSRLITGRSGVRVPDGPPVYLIPHLISFCQVGIFMPRCSLMHRGLYCYIITRVNQNLLFHYIFIVLRIFKACSHSVLFVPHTLIDNNSPVE